MDSAGMAGLVDMDAEEPASRLRVPAVLRLAWTLLRRHWLSLLIVLPLLTAVDNALFRQFVFGGPPVVTRPGALPPLILKTVHDVIRFAVLGGLVCGLLLAEAPTVAGRIRRTIGSFGRAWPGLLVFGVASAFPQAATALVIAAAAAGRGPVDAEGFTLAMSVAATAQFAFLLGLAAVLAPLPAAAVAEGRGPVRALDLTQGARLAIGGIRLGFAIAVFAPLKVLGSVLLPLQASRVVPILIEFRAALAEVLWLLLAAAIYRVLADQAPAEVASAFD